MLENVVGQKSAKAKLNFYLTGYLNSQILSPILLMGEKGGGKSLIAKEIAKNLVEFGPDNKPLEFVDPKDKKKKIKKKSFIEINCASIKNLRSWIESVYLEFINGRKATIFFDECSELPHDLQMALLTMLNPSADHKTTFCYKDFIIETNLKDHSYIFATTDPQKINNALKDRLTPIELSPYTNNELAIILKQNLPDVEFEEGLAEEAATYLHGNPRSAVLLATRDIYTYLANRKKFNFNNWKEFIKLLGLYPLGLTSLEISILKVLKENPGGTSLTTLSSRTGLNRGALQRVHESWLMRNNLMEIGELSHRAITSKGIDYLKNLKTT